MVQRFHPFFILLLIFYGISFSAKAQFCFTPETREAYQNLLKLKITPARSQLSSVLTKDPSDGIAIYLENYIDVVTLFINEDPNLYKKLLPNENKRLEALKRLDKNSPWYLFTQAEVRLQWAFVKAKSGDEISAAWSIRQAYKMLEENNLKYPGFHPNKKSFGLMHILIGSIPEKYLWISNLAGMNGGIPSGIKMLNQVIQEDPVYLLESLIIKLAIDYYILNSESTTHAEIKKLYQRNPDNLLISFMYSSVLMKESQSEEALKILSITPGGKEYMSLPFLNYMKGLLLLNKGTYDESRIYFKKYLAEHKGSNFIKDTWYRIFLTYWLSEDEKEAEKCLEKVMNSGVAIYDADKYADNFARIREFPHKDIMRARLYTDGGYYDMALKSIKNISEEQLSQQEKTELHYRYARIYHKSGTTKLAIDKYKKTIESAGIAPDYFAPNSALQLGYIFQKAGNIQKAEEYFKLALSYENHEYKNSIDNKAKAALSDLK